MIKKDNFLVDLGAFLKSQLVSFCNNKIKNRKVDIKSIRCYNMVKSKDINMIVLNNSMEKVTFNMPTELKEKVIALKDELKVSLSFIYNEAIANYLKQKELEKWEKGVVMALQDHEYMQYVQELSNDDGELYEY
jgi:predicted transcriptional regulator